MIQLCEVPYFPLYLISPGTKCRSAAATDSVAYTAWTPLLAFVVNLFCSMLYNVLYYEFGTKQSKWSLGKHTVIHKNFTLAGNIKKKLDTNDCSYGHLTLILSLHYHVKCRSHRLAVYNNEFILGSARVGSVMINWIATNTTDDYCLAKCQTCHITSALSQHVLKMSSSSTNASGKRWRHSLTARSITAWLRAAHSLLMRHFSLSTYDFKMKTK